jgi:UDP-2-acetamido-3-amino-2,3-dideoxy-glucuronate N-acetyltransferase
MSGFVAHPSAMIAEGVSIGVGTRVWQNCIVLAGASIGRGCKLSHNVFVEGNVIVGDRVVIKDNVCLYDGLAVAEDVFIGPNAVFTNVRTPRAFVSRKDQFEKTAIARGVTIGANATIVCGNTIAEYAMIGAGSVVTSDVEPYALMAGNPARRIGWVSRAGEILGADLVCPRTGEKYVVKDGGISFVE